MNATDATAQAKVKEGASSSIALFPLRHSHFRYNGSTSRTRDDLDLLAIQSGRHHGSFHTITYLGAKILE